jgi:hypothetical protein
MLRGGVPSRCAAPGCRQDLPRRPSSAASNDREEHPVPTTPQDPHRAELETAFPTTEFRVEDAVVTWEDGPTHEALGVAVQLDRSRYMYMRTLSLSTLAIVATEGWLRGANPPPLPASVNNLDLTQWHPDVVALAHLFAEVSPTLKSPLATDAETTSHRRPRNTIIRGVFLELQELGQSVADASGIDIANLRPKV